MNLPGAECGDLKLGRALDLGSENVALSRKELELLAVPGDAADGLGGKDGDGGLLVGISRERQAAASLVEGCVADKVRSLDKDYTILLVNL